MWDNLPANPTPHLSNETPFASNRIRKWIMCVICNSNLLKCKVICFRHFVLKPRWMFPWYFITFFPISVFWPYVFTTTMSAEPKAVRQCWHWYTRGTRFSVASKNWSVSVWVKQMPIAAKIFRIPTTWSNLE